MLFTERHIFVYQQAKNARIRHASVRLWKTASIAVRTVKPQGIPSNLLATAGTRIAASTQNNRYWPTISRRAHPGMLAGWSFIKTMCLVLGKGKPDASALLYTATDFRICL